MIDRIFERFRRFFVGLFCIVGTVLIGTSAAQADWRKDLGTFRIGISATDAGSLTPMDIENLKVGFSKALGMPTELIIMRDYPALIDAHVSSRIEYAIYSSTAYAIAWLLCECVEPLVAPVLTDGATGIRSTLVINAGVPFTRLDLNGIRIGIPGKDSITGYALPLAQYTIGSRALTQDESFFNKFLDLKSTLEAFGEGRIDGFFGWTEADAKGPISASGLMATGEAKSFSVRGKPIEIKIPWTSGLLRYGPHAIRRNLPTEAKDALRTYFANLDEIGVDLLSHLPPNNVAKFIPATQDEYATSIAVAKSAATISK